MENRREWCADVIIQVFGLVCAIAGAIILLILTGASSNGIALLAVTVYGVSLLGMFSCSILNAVAWNPVRKAWYKTLDHSAIYVLIAGTYTPFCLLVIRGREGIGLLAVIWGMAVLGMLARVVFRRWLAQARITLYVLMGWAGLCIAPSVFTRLSSLGVVLLLTGGVIYTVAAPLHRYTRLRYHAAVWHGCVVIAACCHYVAVLLVLNTYMA